MKHPEVYLWVTGIYKIMTNVTYADKAAVHSIAFWQSTGH